MMRKPNMLFTGSQDSNVANVVVEPLVKGYGHTIGNSLRRVLLSSIEGSAVTSVSFSNSNYHEFSVIRGIYEDVQTMVANISSVVFKVVGDSDMASIDVKAKGEYYASSIKSSNSTVVNQDMYLFTVNEELEDNLTINITVKKGKGHVPASIQRNSSFSEIHVDSYFSPVLSVKYEVQNARVEQITDYDKLTITVVTNGSVAPKDAILEASSILAQHFIHLNPDASTESYSGITAAQNEDVSSARNDTGSSEDDFDPRYIRPVEDLDLSVRSENSIKNEGIKYIGDLVQKTESDMLTIANFGKKSLDEIKLALRKIGLSFGTHIENWPPRGYQGDDW